MAIVPAHLQRSVGGGFDNESVAISALVATFYCWCRALRTERSWPNAGAAGHALAYAYMAAAWGGYVFVINLVAAHAAALVLLGRPLAKVARAYSLFYAMGTALATRVPVVGYTPLTRSSNCRRLLVFVAIGSKAVEAAVPTAGAPAVARSPRSPGGAAAAALAAVALGSGAWGPVSARVRALFMEHTRTGNPLVDSVAEHAAASPDAYWRYLREVCYVAPVGAARLVTRRGGPSDAGLFLLLHGAAAYYFSSRMTRLVVLLGAPAAALAGVAVGGFAEWAAAPLLPESAEESAELPQTAAASGASAAGRRRVGWRSW